MRTAGQAVQSALRELRARRARLALLIPLEAAGVAALFTAIALYDAVLLRPLRFPDAEALVEIWHSQPQRGTSQLSLTLEEADFYRREATSLESSVIFNTGDAFVADADEPEAVRIVRVLGDLCRVLRTPPIAGRCLTDADAAPAAPPVAVIRATRATRRYGDPARALGRVVRIDDTMREVVGVVSDNLQLRAFGGFLYGPVDYMMPLIPSPDPRAGLHMLVGRLAPPQTFSETEAELIALSRAYATHVPNDNDGKVAKLWLLSQQTVQYAGPQSKAIIAGAILLAVLVVFNSALLRAVDIGRRRSTLAIKAALGASARRLSGEEIAVALGGIIVTGLVASSLAMLVARFVRTEPWGLPGLRQEAFPLYFTIALALVCGLGTVASLVFVRRNMAYGEGVGPLPSRAVGESKRSARWSRGMVAAQCTMAVMLVGATLLLLKTMWNLAHVDVGIRTENLSIIETRLPTRFVESSADRLRALERLFESRTEHSSAGGLALVNALPLMLRGELRRVQVPALGNPDGTTFSVSYRVVSPNYFRIAGIRLLGGRAPGPHDSGQSVDVVVNRTFARRYLDGREPIGMPIRVLPEAARASIGLQGTIVGVIADVRHWGPDRPAPPEFYVSYQADPPTKFALLWRPAGPGADSAEQAAGAIRERLRLVAPELAAFPVSSMSAVADAYLGMRRFASGLFGVFASVAILVTALGLYGLTAGYVSARRAEIAVRMSIGAGRKSVASLVAKQALIPAAVGCLVGTGALIAAGRVLQAWLYETSPTDLSLLLLLPICMAVITIAATLAPLLSALRVLPIELLRGR